MPDMTGEFKRKLDLADKASIDLIALNNKVVAMRSAVKRSKLYVINKITTNIKKLRQKKGTEEQKKQNATKADKLVEEIKIIKNILSANSGDPDQTPHFVASDLGQYGLPMSHKKEARLVWVKETDVRAAQTLFDKMLKPDYVSKYALGTTETFQKIICEPNLGMERRALARLAEHRFIQDFVKKFREEHNDWKELTAYLMTKHTSREYKKRRNKQKLQNTDKVAMNIKVTEKIVESYLGDKLKHLGEEIGKEASESDKTLKNESKPERMKSVQNKKGLLSKEKVGDNIDESDSDSSELNTSSDEKSDSDVSTRKQSLGADDNSNNESEDGDSVDSDENESSDIGDLDNNSDSESGSKFSDLQRSSYKQLVKGETSSSESDFEDVPIKLKNSEMDAKNKFVQSSVKLKNNRAKREKLEKKTISNSQNEKEKLVSEKKTGEMIVKRINLEELKDDTIDAESSNKVPEFLLETALTKSKRKTNDPFFCASDEENDDDKNSAQADDDVGDEDNDIDDEFGNSEEFTGISGLSTTFVGSLKSDEMMKCSKQFRSNEDWKKLRQEKFTRGAGRRGGGQSFRGRGGFSQGGRGQSRGDRGISRGHRGESQGRGRGGSDLGSSQSQQRQQPDFKKSSGESLLQPSYLSHVSKGGSKPSPAANEGTKSGEEKLHPSWMASKKRKEQQSVIPAFQGKKIKFDD